MGKKGFRNRGAVPRFKFINQSEIYNKYSIHSYITLFLEDTDEYETRLNNDNRTNKAIVKYSKFDKNNSIKQQNEYLNGQLTFEYCNRTEDTIEFDDDIDDENKVAKIKNSISKKFISPILISTFFIIEHKIYPFKTRVHTNDIDSNKTLSS